MAIDVPDLDDKSYEELIDEATKRLPAYDDDWTDYNPSNPGITLLELLAYLSETYMYQLDSVTDDHRRKYLGLMGTEPRSPEPAAIQLALSLPPGETQSRVPAGTKLTVVDRSETEKVFETRTDVALTDATVETVITDHREGRTDHTQANEKDGMFFRALGDRAEPMNAMYLGFDSDPFAELDQLTLTVDFHDEDLPQPAEHGDETSKFFPSVSILWEYCTDYEQARRDDAWQRLAVVRDGTYAFYRSGSITLTRPEPWEPEAWGVSDHGVVEQEPGQYWIRCRVLRGGYEIPPQLNSVRLNVVTATHQSTVEDETLQSATRTVEPALLNEQTYVFEHSPVLEAEITVDGVPWEEVTDFDASGPTDRHYTLDNAAGRIQFGDGINGKMPNPTASVLAPRYVFGGGRDGNVSASAVWRFLDRDTELESGVRLGNIDISSVSAGSGGRDEESLTEAFRRVRRDMTVPYRAVTMDDYRYIATHTPGLRFGRANVLVEERDVPEFDENPVEVRVVVVPYAPMNQSRPEPSEGFLEAVDSHLDTYRLMTDRVVVEAPTYVDLAFDIEIQTSRFIPESRGRRAIETKIEEYVHPVHGFDGEGWPFGRTLYSEEITSLVEDIGFVDHIRSLDITPRGTARVDGNQNVLIRDDTLFALDAVRIDITTVLGNRGE